MTNEVKKCEKCKGEGWYWEIGEGMWGMPTDTYTQCPCQDDPPEDEEKAAP